MACPCLVQLVVPPVLRPMPLASEHHPPLAQLIPLISEDVLSSTRIPKRGERCSAPLIPETRRSWGQTGPRGCSCTIPVPLPPGERSSAPIPERSRPSLLLPLCFRGCVYQHGDPHHHLPRASPLPARPGLGWLHVPLRLTKPLPFPHVPSLSVICQVVRNKVLEPKTCSVMSRKGLRRGGWRSRSI